MKQLSKQQRAAVIRCLVEGCSIRSITRITGVAKNTIQKLTRDMSEAAVEYMDSALSNLKCKRVQMDEIWNFCYCKDKNCPDELVGEPGIGSMWTWTSMCADTKLMISWLVGNRDATSAWHIVNDTQERLAERVQLSTDGLKLYLEPIDQLMRGKVDYGMVVKMFSSPGLKDDTRYSPAKCLGARRSKVMGDPDRDHISTSYAERQNLNIRMQNRRFTRLTNAFSKKAEMLSHSLNLTFFYHNFIRVHQTLKTTPAMAAGCADKVWTVEDMVSLIPETKYDTHPKKRKLSQT